MASELDLTLVQTAADVLRVPASDASLPRLVTAASSAVARWLGYPVHRRRGVVETPAGLGGRYLFLRAGAVRQVTSVAVDGAVLDASTYALESALMGRLVGRTQGWPFTGTATGGVSSTPLRAVDEGRIVVTFDAGWVTPGQKAAEPTLEEDLPYELEQAALEVVTAWYRRAGLDADVQSRSVGGGSISFGEKSALPATARQLLASYRKTTRRVFG